MNQHGQTHGVSPRSDWQDMSPPLMEEAGVACFKMFPLPRKNKPLINRQYYTVYQTAFLI